MAQVIRPYDLLLDTTAGWRMSDASTAVSVAGGSIQLQTQQRLLPDVNDPNGSFGGHTLPLGVAIWDEQIFIADPANHAIRRWRLCRGALAPLATIGGFGSAPRQLDTPRGLAVNRRGDLVVVDSGNHRLLLFTLPGLALRRIVGPLADGSPPSTWQPVDVAPGPRGRLFVADANGRIWRLDAQSRPDAHYPGALPAGFTPLRLQVDTQGRAYVIGSAATDPILMLDPFGRLTPTPEQLEAAVRTWLEQHMPNPNDTPTFEQEAEARAAVLPAELSRMIDVDLNRYLAALQRQDPQRRKAEIWADVRAAAYAVDPPGVIPQAYAAHLRAFFAQVLPAGRLALLGYDLYSSLLTWLDAQGLDPRQIDHLRLAYNALAAGRAQTAGSPTGHVLLLPGDRCPRPPLLTDLVVDKEGRLDSLYVLHRPPAATYELSGLFRTQPLDSGRAGNAWHRIVLELTIPDRTSVRLFSFTSDVPRPDLATTGLLLNPPQPGGWQAAVANVDEWLIQSPPGRYLYLALLLQGPGDRTPTVERIYLYANRQSSLRYLPAAYHEDETSRHLLDRLLSLFDTIYGEIESKIEQFPLYLDIRGAPPDFLPWLASWFDLQLEQSWSDAQKRAFLKEIVDLYAWRGTVRGLKRLLQLHTGLAAPLPHIIEHFRAPAHAPASDLPTLSSQPAALTNRGDAGAALAYWLGSVPDAAHHFTILLPARHLDTPDKRGLLRRLIDAGKPAHTHYTLRPTYPGTWLGSGATRASALGLDTVLGSQGRWRLPAEDAEPQPVPAAHRLLVGEPPPRLGHARIGTAQLRRRDRLC